MFLGTTPVIISQFLYKEFKDLKPARVFVPFAGNFVIEQLCGSLDKSIEVHSTDVSLYSRGIGFGLTDQLTDIRLKDFFYKDFPIFTGKTSAFDVAIQVIFFLEAATAWDRSATIKYYLSLYKDAVDNQEKYVEQISTKFQKFKDNLGKLTFYGIDACELFPLVKEGDVVFYDPPFWAGGYEKMFENLEKCFDYEPVKYTEIDEELKNQQLENLRERGAIVYYRTLGTQNNLPEGYSEVYRYQYKYHLSYSLYTNKGKNKFTGWREMLKEKPAKYEIIDQDDVITEDSKIEIVQTESPIANHYRLLWVKKAEMVQALYNYLILIDGKLVGLLCLDSGIKYGCSYILLMADPAPPTSRYLRLSKLVLYLVSTWEFINEFNDRVMWDHIGLTTRVYTDAPVSMKYRGIFKLAERKEAKEGNHKYSLIYRNEDNIFATYRDALQEWLKRYGNNIIGGE